MPPAASASTILRRIGFGCGVALASATGALWSCGGRTSSNQEPADAGLDAATTPPECLAEGGYIACRGTNDCPTESEECLQCFGDPDAAGLCGTAAMAGQGTDFCPVCSDGNVCIQLYIQSGYLCLPFNVGQLLANNGAADRVRYADWSQWTGQALPEPTECADGGLPLCGGLCAPCPQDSICTGRSPLHPYGFCVPKTWSACTKAEPGCASSGNRCFVFTDPADAQALANDNGLCLPSAECEALGAGYPGGGACLGDD